MKASNNCVSLIHGSEGFRSSAYLDNQNNGVWTIGFGTTRYPDKSPVKEGDTCTKEQATEWFLKDLGKFEKQVSALLKKPVSQSQFDALVSFAYNVGTGPTGLGGSTLLQLINVNPDDPMIAVEFCKWNKDNGKRLVGLVRRRLREATLYFK